MKVFIALLVLLIVLYVAFESIRFFHTIQVSKQLIKEAMPFQENSTDTESSTSGPSVLVLGDSTAVGVGASRPQDSIAGRVASAVGASYVENHGISGARVKDLPAEIKEVKRNEYDVIIVQIGANDITHFDSPTKTANELVKTLSTLPKSSHVIVMSAGDVGVATAIPYILRGYFTALTMKYHQAFERDLSAAGYTYVNLYNAPRNQLFTTDPGTYLAKDGFHPSSAGYGIWFEAVAPVLPKS